MSCHARGLLPKGDMVRAHVDKNRKAFTAADVDTVLALYPPKTRLQKSIDEDNERYTKALTALAIAPDADEPVNLVTRRYEAPLDIALAECNRFYPAFQSVLWGGAEVDHALEIALLETVGEA